MSRPSPLDNALDIFRVRQYFNAITFTRELFDGVRRDASFLGAARRAVFPLQSDRRPVVDRHPFPPLQRRRDDEGLRKKRVALLSTGGSGALASVVGPLAPSRKSESGRR